MQSFGAFESQQPVYYSLIRIVVSVCVCFLFSFFLWLGGLVGWMDVCDYFETDPATTQVTMWHLRVAPSSLMNMEEASLTLFCQLQRNTVCLVLLSVGSTHTWKQGPQQISLFQDKEETAQWVSSPATLQAMLEAALSRVSSMKRETCIVHNYMAYDGVLEKARLGQAAYFFFGVKNVCP